MKCEVPGRVVVVGGHDSWLREIKQVLTGNVKYVDRVQRFNPALIRNSDAVWIQRNAISHSQYYKIMKIAKEHNVSVRYFGFASVQKCVAQLMGE